MVVHYKKQSILYVEASYVHLAEYVNVNIYEYALVFVRNHKYDRELRDLRSHFFILTAYIQIMSKCFAGSMMLCLKCEFFDVLQE